MKKKDYTWAAALLVLCFAILAASCTDRYRAKKVGSNVTRVIELDHGYQVSDTVMYRYEEWVLLDTVKNEQ